MDSARIRGIQEEIRKKYTEVSESTADRFPYPTGQEGAESLGYDPSMIEKMPEEVLSTFCGVGNPFSLGKIHRGETVLDVGCGAGFDMIVASYLVGPSGRVCGIDLTPAMLSRAQMNLKQLNISNAEVQLASSEEIPYNDGTFDVVISNGVLNLSLLKEKSFKEIYRVLKDHGRLQIADIILIDGQPQANACSIDAWSD